MGNADDGMADDAALLDMRYDGMNTWSAALLLPSAHSLSTLRVSSITVSRRCYDSCLRLRFRRAFRLLSSMCTVVKATAGSAGDDRLSHMRSPAFKRNPDICARMCHCALSYEASSALDCDLVSGQSHEGMFKHLAQRSY